MSIRAYTIFGIILFVCGLLITALFKVARKADDEEKEWREKHERHL